MSSASSSPSSPPKATPAALQIVKAKASASLLPNNLVCGSRSYAYIHRNEVHLVDSKCVALGVEKVESTRAAYAEKEHVNQVEFIKHAQLGEILVVLNQGGGVFVYDETGQKLIHSFKHNKASPSAAASTPTLTAKEAYLRGLAYDGKETIYIGCGNGELIVLTLNKSKLMCVKCIHDGHNDSLSNSGGISSLIYDIKHSLLISGDDYGRLVMWSGAGADIAYNKTITIEGKGAPVNSLAVGHGHIIAAFASGHVRLYDPIKRLLTVEICAHTRAINGLDIHLTRPMFMVCSEDTYVSVWSLPTPLVKEVKHFMAEPPVLALLTGCRFGGGNQEFIVTTSYDSRGLAIMHTP